MTVTMNTKRTDTDSRRRALRSYSIYGAILCAALFLLVVIVVSKPYFQEWSTAKSLVVVFGSGLLGAAVGYVAIFLAVTPGHGVDGTELLANDTGHKQRHEGGVLDADPSHMSNGSGLSGHDGNIGGDA
jgi:hypothetical protein